MSPLGWTLESTRQLAGVLVDMGHQVSHSLVGILLHELGYSLQATAKVQEGTLLTRGWPCVECPDKELGTANAPLGNGGADKGRSLLDAWVVSGRGVRKTGRRAQSPLGRSTISHSACDRPRFLAASSAGRATQLASWRVTVSSPTGQTSEGYPRQPADDHVGHERGNHERCTVTAVTAIAEAAARCRSTDRHRVGRRRNGGLGERLDASGAREGPDTVGNRARSRAAENDLHGLLCG